MKVSRKSWHYRLNEKVFGYTEYNTNNLCKYFWSTFFSVFIVVFLALTFLTAITVIIIMAIEEPYETISVLILVFFIIFCVSIPPFVIVFTRARYNTDTKYIMPSIVKEYYNVLKGKFCPRIFYTDD